MLPAAHGDCLFITYDGDDSEQRRLIIDGGPHYAYPALQHRILDLPEDDRTFELLVVTHIDADHIDGAIVMLQDDALGATFNDIWFNGWKHIQNYELGAVGGEFLGALLEDRAFPWNDAWDGDTIVVPEPGQGDLPSKTLAGGLTLTLLSPGVAELKQLNKEWKRALKAAKFSAPGDSAAALEELKQRKYLQPKALPLGDTDDSEANGSSIALLLETHDGHSALLAGDAYAEVLYTNLRRLMQERTSTATYFAVDVFKLAHHGSKKNMDPLLAKLIDAKHILVSTSGAIFEHPNEEPIDLLIELRGQRRPHFIFNYRSAFNAKFENGEDQKLRKYDASYPKGNSVDVY